MKAKLVIESLEFQRGQDTKKSLTLGRETLIRTTEGLAQIFAEDFKDLEPINVKAYEWKGEMDELTFDISEDIIKDTEDLIGYDAEFDSWLEERIEDWVLKETPYILNSFFGVQKAPTGTKDGINYYTYDINFDNLWRFTSSI